MKLSTLLAIGAVVVWGLFIARNADGWMNRLHTEKAHVVAAVKTRLNTEEARVRTALNERIASEEARVRASLTKRLDQERTALRKRLARERARSAAALRKRREEEKARAAAARKAAGPESPPAAPAGMTDVQFWGLISETRSAAGNDTAKQSDLLEERLTQLSPQAILDFAQIRRTLDERADTWDLRGAAAVIESGCSDDCFRTFRGYLISLGEGPYENALGNPDSLASVVQDAESGGWAAAADVAPEAYSSVTGRDFPLDDSDPSGEPRGTPFDENDAAGLALRYPALAARFR